MNDTTPTPEPTDVEALLVQVRMSLLDEVAAEDDRQYAGGSRHGLGALGGAEMALDVLAAALVPWVAQQRADALRPFAELADEWQEQARLNERGGHFPWAMWQNRANDLRALLARADRIAPAEEDRS